MSATRRLLPRVAQWSVAFGLGLFLGGRWCAGSPKEPLIDGPAAVAVHDAPHRMPSGAFEPEGPPAERSLTAPGARQPSAPVAPTPAAGMLRDAGGVAEDAVQAPVGCHPQTAREAPVERRSPRSTRRVQLEIANDCDDTVLYSWLNFDGVEESPRVALAGAHPVLQTYEGHVFRLRTSNVRRAFVRDFVAPSAKSVRVYVCGCKGESGVAPEVGTEGFELLDAGSAAETSVPQCRVPFDAEPVGTTASVTESSRYPMIFRNSCTATRVELFWVQFDGGLRPTGELDPGDSLDQGSFVGHQWRVRDATTGRWIRDFVLDGGPTQDLCACE